LGKVTFKDYSSAPFDKIIKCCQFLKETYNTNCLPCEPPKKLGLWEYSTVTQCENKKYKLELFASYGGAVGQYNWNAHISFGTISFLKWSEARYEQLLKEWEEEEKQKLEKSKDDLR